MLCYIALENELIQHTCEALVYKFCVNPSVHIYSEKIEKMLPINSDLAVADAYFVFILYRQAKVLDRKFLPRN